MNQKVFTAHYNSCEQSEENDQSINHEVDRTKCVACSSCRYSCPVDAITIAIDTSSYAKIDKNLCICCYCCYETCKYNAIILRENLFID